MFLFSAEDYELPLEQKFKLRKIKDEIESCTDMDALKQETIKAAELLMNYQHLDALKQETIKAAELLMNYQHLLSKAVQELITANGVGMLPPCENS